MNKSLLAELEKIVGADYIQHPVPPTYLTDATETQIRGAAEALLLPGTTEEVVQIMRYCYKHDIPMTVRGAGSGLAGGAIPASGVVIGMERFTKIRSFEPTYWRMEAEVGVITATVQNLAAKHGLSYPPDPGSLAFSHIGGNIATNAGGGHTFKYGVTSQWVTGLEVVVPPGKIVRMGGPWRKDVAGYDLTRLFIGSEGTLGIITAAWLKLMPAPPSRLAIAAFFDSPEIGCETASQLFSAGVYPSALEYLDEKAFRAASKPFPVSIPPKAQFLLITEVDGNEASVKSDTETVLSLLNTKALEIFCPDTPEQLQQLWKWRYSTTPSVIAKYGGKVSEDIVVPLEHVAAAVKEIIAIGKRYDLPACSWGHLGDGNLHATFMFDWHDKAALKRAQAAAEELFDMTLRMGGSLSGEHGLGKLKNHRLTDQSGELSVAYQRQIKQMFDPKGLLNPGTLLPLE